MSTARRMLTVQPSGSAELVYFHAFDGFTEPEQSADATGNGIDFVRCGAYQPATVGVRNQAMNLDNAIAGCIIPFTSHTYPSVLVNPSSRSWYWCGFLQIGATPGHVIAIRDLFGSGDALFQINAGGGGSTFVYVYDGNGGQMGLANFTYWTSALYTPGRWVWWEVGLNDGTPFASLDNQYPHDSEFDLGFDPDALVVMPDPTQTTYIVGNVGGSSDITFFINGGVPDAAQRTFYYNSGSGRTYAEVLGNLP